VDVVREDIEFLPQLCSGSVDGRSDISITQAKRTSHSRARFTTNSSPGDERSRTQPGSPESSPMSFTNQTMCQE
jgi:hypothetical protein